MSAKRREEGAMLPPAPASPPSQPPTSGASAIRWGTAKPQGSTQPVVMDGDLSTVILDLGFDHALNEAADREGLALPSLV